MGHGWKRRLALAVLFAALASGCFESAFAAESDPEEAGSTSKPISTDEARTLARLIERGMDARDGRALDNAIDFDALAMRCLARLVRDEQFKAGFVRGMRKDGLGGSIAPSLGRIGSYRMVRLHKSKDGQPCVLFRLVAERTGLNYHDLMLGRDARGEVRIVDVYNYLQGQAISRTMRFIIAAGVAGGDESMREFIAAKPDLDKVLKAQVHGDYRGAWEAYGRLPEALKMERSVLLARVEIAGKLDESTYARALGDFNRAYPADPSVDFVTLDSLLSRHRTQEALAAVDRIDKQVGGDGYLDLIRAHANFDAGRRAQGKRDLERFLAFGPSMKEGYLVGVDAALKARDWGEVVRLIKMSRGKAGLPWGGIDSMPEMAEFRRSAEFRQFKREEAVRNGLAGEGY
jgi:hypothetical protein